MPRDRLPFTIFICREVDGGVLLDVFLEFTDYTFFFSAGTS